MASKTFLCLALIIGIALSASPVLPYEGTLYGPKEFRVGRFHFHSSFQSFKSGKSGDAILEISKANSYDKIRSGFVSLNGRFFSLYPILHTKDSTMQVPVHLRGRNHLWVFLYGQRGAAIKLTVKQAKQEPTNHEPIADAGTVGLDEDTTASITLAGSDQDGDPLTFKIVSMPAHGTLSGNAPALNYTPSADYNGSDTFTFKVNDGQADSRAATVNLTVKPVNDAPIAAATVHIAVIPAKDAPVADPISLAIAKVGEPVSLDGSQSTDVDGDQLTYLWTLTSYPAGIEPALGNATTPSASFVPYLPGEYKMRLVVNDGTVDSSPDDVTISVAYVPFSLTEEKLKASDGIVGDLFGSSVSVDNYRAVIGAEGKETAYVFESNGSWSKTAQLRASDRAAGDHFGSAVAISGEYALIGAYGNDDLGVDSGSAYMFRWDGTQWSQTAKLLADDGGAGDFFGGALSLSGDYAVVGAYGDDTGGDEWVPIFGQDKYVPGDNVAWDSTINGWVNPVDNRILLSPMSWASGFRPKAVRVKHTAQSAINLLRVVGVNNQILGNAPSYSSGTEVSLSNGADIGLIYALTPPAVTKIEFLVHSVGGGLDAGSAYVFKRTGEAWAQQTHLKASDGEEGDAFGVSVTVSGRVIIVGANRDDDKGVDSGSAYVFVQDGPSWVQEAKLLAVDGRAGDQFGTSVAISGNIAVVGAPGADPAGTDSGAAYVFRYNGDNWIEEAKLMAGDGKEGDLFGASVSISSDYVAVGAPGADGSGALYLFKFDGFAWTLIEKVAATDRPTLQDFGGSVSISGDVILSGAMGDSSLGDRAGAAYAFTIDTYHTASIGAEPEIITTRGSSTLSWSWVNALVVQIEPGISTFAVDDHPIGSGSESVSPGVTTIYTITAHGPYGKDTASVTVLVE